MRNNLLLIIALNLVSSSILAQVNLPSWKQHKNKKTDLSTSIFYPSDQNMWVNEIPEIFAKESAVILDQKVVYFFDKKGKILIERMMRRKIKLQDKAALEKFSEFYYNSEVKSGIQVIKANGTKHIVPFEDAIEVRTEVPRIFKSTFGVSSSYYKLAIPNLEIGDIIDFYYLFSEKKNFSKARNGKIMPAYMDILETEYSILNQEYLFYVNKSFYFNFNSFNGAPPLRDVGVAINSNGQIRKDMQVYSLKSEALPKSNPERWTYPLRTRPCIKFQLYNVGDRKTATEFIGKLGVPKNTVSPGEIVNHLRKSQFNYIDSYPYKDFLTRYNDLIETLDDVGVARLFYYIYRSRFLKSFYYSSGRTYKPKDLFNFERPSSINFSQELFCSTLIKVLQKRNIEAEYLVTIPKELGDIDNILFAEELAIFIYLPKSNKIVSPFDNHRNFNDINSSYEGQKAYRFKLNDNSAEPVFVKETRIPHSNPKNNVSKIGIEVTLNNNFRELEIRQSSSYIGAFKASYSTFAFTGVDYIKEEIRRFYENYKFRYVEEASELVAWSKIQKIKQTQIEDRVKTDFELVRHEDFDIIWTGRFSDDTALVFKEHYVIKNLTQKAGKNHLLKIGSLIGKQVALTENEITERQSDVFYDFARTFNVSLTINIPEGFEIKGFEKLDTSIENDFGAFSVKTKLQRGQLIVTTTKVYKKEFIELKNWRELIPILEAAYKFSQSKVILTKMD